MPPTRDSALRSVADPPAQPFGPGEPCEYCLTGSHRRCRAKYCACTEGAHPNRPELDADERDDADLPEGMAWEDPDSPAPPPVGPEVLARLEANPGKWARVREYPKRTSATTVATKINKGATELGTGWEAKSRKFGDAGSTLFLRRRSGTPA